MTGNSKKLFARSALLATGWAENVQISFDEHGAITHIVTGLPTPATDAEKVQGVLLPGIANCHSHAFQRAMVGMAESRGSQDDDFWGWRELMYRFLATMGPDEMRAIATQLYVEMLKAGYTGVAEFHYLHHAQGGVPYDNPAEMSEAIMAAAVDAGIALTLLPVLYQYADFNRVEAGAQQQRFLHSTEDFQKLLAQLASRGSPAVKHGMALHSLRAVDETAIQQAISTLNALHQKPPLHIHIAEQTREVDACLTHTGQRPVEWLFSHFEVDEQWCLVHATHLSAVECRQLADSNAVAGLCLTTEANLGDGLFPAVDYLKHGGRFALGSDSHISVNPVEEMRLLEYGQRLHHRGRTLLTAPDKPSVGAHLYQQALVGGAQALGIKTGAIATGMRADFIVLDETDPVLYGRHQDQLLDSWVFASQRPNVKDVMVAGRWQIRDGQHCAQDRIRDDFFRAIDKLAARA